MTFSAFVAGFAVALCICSLLLYLFAVKERYLIVNAGFCLLVTAGLMLIDHNAITLLITIFFINVLCFWFAHDILNLKWRDKVTRVKYIAALALPAIITLLPPALPRHLILLVPSFFILLLAQAALIAYKFGEIKRFDQIFISENERIIAELDIAREIQESILPNPFFPFPGRDEVELSADMLPGAISGGDIFDYYFIDKFTLALVIADASRRGAHSAVFMALLKTHIKANAKRGMSPGEIFETVNNLLCEESKDKITATAFLGLLHVPRGRLTYVNAGHYPPIIKQGGNITAISPAGDNALALEKNMRFTQCEITFKPGDALFLYTDGVLSAQNADEESFGEHRMINTVGHCMNEDAAPAVLIQTLKSEINSFIGSTPQSDDITMLSMRLQR